MAALLVFLSLDSYLSYSLFGSFYSEHFHWFIAFCTLLFILFLTQAWMFFVFFQSDADAKVRFEKPLKRIAYSSMGVISFLFTFTLLRDLSSFFLIPFGNRPILYSPEMTTFILILSAGCIAVGFRNAKQKLLTPEILIRIKELPKELEGIRILHLTDVHLGSGPNLSEINHLINLSLNQKPDLIVLTGDIIDGAISEIGEELKALGRLKAHLGVFFVLGNHECYWNHERSIQAIRDLGFTVLLNDGVEVEQGGKKLYLAGVTDPAITLFKGIGPEIPIPPADSAVRILLAHQPQIAKRVCELPYHLQLSGHTHGGQFFPWNLAVKGIYLHPGGLNKIKDLLVYVSHGTGYWGPPLRLGTFGEVTTLVLTQKRESAVNW